MKNDDDKDGNEKKIAFTVLFMIFALGFAVGKFTTPTIKCSPSADISFSGPVIEHLSRNRNFRM